MGAVQTELSWLSRAPADFAEQCRKVAFSPGPIGRQLWTLASHALDENQLNRIAQLIARARESRASLAPLTPFRLGIISNATTDLIAPALIATAARYGIALECVQTPFGQGVQEALSPDSAINRAGLNAVMVAIDYRGVDLACSIGEPERSKRAVDRAIQYIGMVRDAVHRNGNAFCIVQTLARPPEPLFGNADFLISGTTRSLIHEINRGIVAELSGTDVLLDVAALAETVGLANWHDPTYWNLAKLPFSNSLLPLYADNVCRVIAAVLGKSRRCLVLDLDNTVWGGVVGDDGPEGILIGQGDPTGEAHLDVQRTALALRERGIVLAVSTKNHDIVARRPFREHPDMLLKEDHIAIFQANWNDKPTNLRAIARSLNLGLESLVLLDDNPAERALVRQELPEVFVPELPEDPALYAQTLLASGCFEATVFSAEDRQRADYYQDNARRVALEASACDIDAYLRSLDMTLSVRPFDDIGRKRIVQLIAKSNQYNLTTRRYSEAEIRDIEADPDCFTLQARLTDRFGDNGMISVVICRRSGRRWTIDTWLMSCRVLGRRVEHALLSELISHARRLGISDIIGEYRPTERNKLVEDHYSRLGFELVDRRDDGTVMWRLSAADARDARCPIAVQTAGFDVTVD